MEQREPPGGTMAGSPVVRQLDFTAELNSTGKPSSIMILPEHPQAQLELKLRALAQANSRAPSPSPSPPRVAVQRKLPPRKMVMPPKSPIKELSLLGPVQLDPKTPGFAFSADPVPPHFPALQQPLTSQGSPNRHESAIPEQVCVTSNKKRKCNCKNSKCLKLYCDCFSSGTYCDGCNCINCVNTIEFDEFRRESIRAVLERNPDAFKPKVSNSPHKISDLAVEHNKGCNCKKTACLKKYCECYQANTLCSDKCKCVDCKNYEESEERRLHLHSISLIQQPKRVAAFYDTTGSPPNKKTKARGSQFPQLPPQETFSTYVSHSPVIERIIKPNPSVPRLLKHSYRSPLSGILREEHIRDFCNTLVKVAVQSPRFFSDGEVNINGTEVSGQENRENKCQNHSLGFIENPRRPLSPGTLALICDEQDKAFMGVDAASQSDKTRYMQSSSSQGLSRSYVESERLVLSSFCSFLNTVITRGSIQETKPVLENMAAPKSQQ